MWALPNIQVMNAVKVIEQNEHEEAVKNPQDHCCLVCEWHGKETAADYGYLTHDIYLDVPNGTVFLCETHDGATGSPVEGYFTCEDCNRVLMENITWELHYVILNECEQVCIPCALKRALADENNWINVAEVKSVVIQADPDGKLFDPENGKLNLGKSQHLIAVNMDIPEEIVFYDNAEFDSANGKQISGHDAFELVQRIEDGGYTKFFVVLDAAYQFAVSIGFYVSREEHDKLLAE